MMNEKARQSSIFRLIPRFMTGLLSCLWMGGLLFSSVCSAQEAFTIPDTGFLAKKSITALRISSPPKIDGRLDEPFWQQLPVAGDFVQFSPRNMNKPCFNSEFRFAYDDVALYVGAIMYDPSPDSICKELGRRDMVEVLNNDFFSVDILPFNDAINMYEFKLSPANVQSDTKYSAVGSDYLWDGVWTSAVEITSYGWVAEIRIPYSALRFPGTKEQVWGINMWRNVQRRQEYSTWTWVDNKVDEIFKYYGVLEGISNIKPPVRLSFMPYVSGYLEKDPGKSEWSYYFRGGADLKYGISDSYTLDMILIPDFGQVQSDDVILNLTPYEVQYDEKRQFFTEGTELFNKCDIFYTRRIGSTPVNYYGPFYDTGPTETVVKNPEETMLVNATKISGRNANGLGLGFFNAITTNTWAEIKDTVTGAKRSYMTQPFTNYNVLVVDQTLENYSYITFINTNYYIPESHYCANVTGTEFKLSNYKNTFYLFGNLSVSQKYLEDFEPDLGFRYKAGIGKPSGNFQFLLSREEVSDHYDINDMGYLPYNNEAGNTLRLSYNVYKPVGKIISMRNNFYTIYTTLSRPYEFSSLKFELSSNTTFRNYWTFYIAPGIFPYGVWDHYEPRVWGWVYKKPWYYTFSTYVTTDPRKKLMVTLQGYGTNAPETAETSYEILVAPRFRFSNHFNITFQVDYGKNLNNYGFADLIPDTGYISPIIFGRRNITNVNNILSVKYIFNTKTSLSLRLRHNWTKAEYLDFYFLDPDGHLQPQDQFSAPDINFNAFSADLQFVWYFAPGSEMSVVWKNTINTYDDIPAETYFHDLSNMAGAPQWNSFSVKILYYLDYLYLKKAFAKKEKKTDEPPR